MATDISYLDSLRYNPFFKNSLKSNINQFILPALLATATVGTSSYYHAQKERVGEDKETRRNRILRNTLLPTLLTGLGSGALILGKSFLDTDFNSLDKLNKVADPKLLDKLADPKIKIASSGKTWFDIIKENPDKADELIDIINEDTKEKPSLHSQVLDWATTKEKINAVSALAGGSVGLVGGVTLGDKLLAKSGIAIKNNDLDYYNKLCAEYIGKDIKHPANVTKYFDEQLGREGLFRSNDIQRDVLQEQQRKLTKAFEAYKSKPEFKSFIDAKTELTNADLAFKAKPNSANLQKLKIAQFKMESVSHIDDLDRQLRYTAAKLDEINDVHAKLLKETFTGKNLDFKALRRGMELQHPLMMNKRKGLFGKTKGLAKSSFFKFPLKGLSRGAGGIGGAALASLLAYTASKATTDSLMKG